MPVAKIHVLEGQYDDARLGKVSKAVQDGLMNALGVPPDDFFSDRSRSASKPFPAHAVFPGTQIFG